MFDKDKFKTSLTNYDIGQAISHFNGESFEGENGELISTTVCHHKSGGSHKLYYYSDTQMFHCYTGCGSFDIYSLIEKRMTMEGLNPNFGDTIKRLGTILGININFNSKIIGVQKSIKTINDWDWLNKVKRKEKIEPQLQTHNKFILSYFKNIVVLKENMKLIGKTGNTLKLQIQGVDCVKFFLKEDDKDEIATAPDLMYLDIICTASVNSFRGMN